MMFFSLIIGWGLWKVCGSLIRGLFGGDFLGFYQVGGEALLDEEFAEEPDGGGDFLVNLEAFFGV
jgi:hypothetical protein